MSKDEWVWGLLWLEYDACQCTRAGMENGPENKKKYIILIFLSFTFKMKYKIFHQKLN